MSWPSTDACRRWWCPTPQSAAEMGTTDDDMGKVLIVFFVILFSRLQRHGIPRLPEAEARGGVGGRWWYRRRLRRCTTRRWLALGLPQNCGRRALIIDGGVLRAFWKSCRTSSHAFSTLGAGTHIGGDGGGGVIGGDGGNCGGGLRRRDLTGMAAATPVVERRHGRRCRPSTCGSGTGAR